MNDEIAVSIFCLAYNHEKYIRQTLEGFVCQKTSFRFEVLIHDDASTDNTQAIILEYQKRYPDIIKSVLQKENQYSKKVPIQATFNYPRAKGKYIAFCEGDDYWSDDHKLQRQYDAMEQNANCTFCVHKTRRMQKDGTLMKSCFPDIDIPEGVISADKFMHYELVEHPWLFQTSSFFLKKECYDKYLTAGKSFKKHFPAGDKPLVLFLLSEGDCYYIAEEMSRYRTNSGVLSVINIDVNKNVNYYNRFIQGYKAFDVYTHNKYQDEIQFMILSLEIRIYRIQGEYRKILGRKYCKVLKKMSLKNKLEVVIGCALPKIVYSFVMRKKRREKNKVD